MLLNTFGVVGTKTIIIINLSSLFHRSGTKTNGILLLSL